MMLQLLRKNVFRLYINTGASFYKAEVTSYDVHLPLVLFVCEKPCKRPTVPPLAERKPRAKGVVSPSWTDTLMLDTEVVIITGASR